MDIEQELIDRLDEQKRLEDEIRQRRARLSKLRSIITGDKDNIGLASLVEIERRKREWNEGAPGRAAVRATPEWQAWRAQFMAGEEVRVTKLMEWWAEEKIRRAQK